MPAPQDSFRVLSLTAEGRDLTGTGPLTFAPGSPVKIEGEIVFEEPPMGLLAQFVIDDGGHGVIANEEVVLIDPTRKGPNRPARFTLTLNAPPQAGEYVLRLIAPPSGQATGAAVPERAYLRRRVTVNE